jgi:predicted methyltransferase
MIVLSHFQAKPILEAMRAGKEQIEVSLDLGLETAVIPLTAAHVTFPDGQTLTVDQLEEMMANELACYRIENNDIEKIQYFSETLNRYYSLMPTIGAPTMLISGLSMHRIKGTEPHKDTMAKIKAVVPVTGRVLDTTMGLGYTAIAAAKTAEHVTTIELDPTVVDVCRSNPWSQDLFNRSNITRLIGDAFDRIEEFDDESFSRIVHDPPMFKLAGHLYSSDFYRELYRVLKAKGRVFHYIGDPKSKSGGTVTRGVVRRLQEVGFRRVKPWPRAFGVIAYK